MVIVNGQTNSYFPTTPNPSVRLPAGAHSQDPFPTSDRHPRAEAAGAGRT